MCVRRGCGCTAGGLERARAARRGALSARGPWLRVAGGGLRRARSAAPCPPGRWNGARCWGRWGRWRIAWRGGRQVGRAAARNATLTAHIEVVGELRREVQVRRRRRASGKRRRGAPRARLCYDGEAWESVLADPGRGAGRDGRARRCSWRAGPARTGRRWRWRRPKRARGTIAASRRCSRSNIRSRARCRRRCSGGVRLRRAEAFAWRAFDEARRGNLDPAARAEGAAVRELALTDRGRAGARGRRRLRRRRDPRRGVALGDGAPRRSRRASAPSTSSFAPRGEGETCVRVVQAAGAGRTRAVGERCTYGVVWPGALRWAASGTAADRRGAAAGGLDGAVGDAPGWRRRVENGCAGARDRGSRRVGSSRPPGSRPTAAACWSFAKRGWRPSSPRFQVVASSTLAVERWAAHADKLGAFKRWSTPSWRAGTLVLR